MSKKKSVKQVANELRGKILGLSVEFERSLDDFIAAHFCKDEIREMELKELLLFTERITLDSKRAIFCVIVQKHYPQFLEQNADCLDEIGEIIPHRNVLAHLEINLEKSVWEGETGKLAKDDEKRELVFKKYKNGKLTDKGYCESVIYDIMDMIKFNSEIISELAKTVNATQNKAVGN